MSKKGIKSRLLVEDRLLGTLLYDTDKEGRGYIKFSIKNKIANFVKSTDIPTKLPTALKLKEPTSLEISYKFKDQLLGTKRVVDGKIYREFYKVPTPAKSCLFALRVKDYSFYDKYEKNRNTLVLNPPSTNKSVLIIFSFLDKNGMPFTVPGYKCHVMGMIDLPETNCNELCIGIVEDTKDYGNQDIEVLVPMHSI